MTARSLGQVLAAYEERGVAALQAFVASTPPTEARLDALVAAVGDPRAEVVATWLLRAYLERGVELGRSQTAGLLRSLARLRSDDARLHVCQLVARLDVPARNAEQLARFLREGARGDHKFTRAWATDAFHRLSLQHRRFRPEALVLLERASRDPAPSVRARARRIEAEMGPSR